MHWWGTKEPLYFHHYYATMIWRQSHPNVWFLSYCWHQISPSSSFVPLFYDWCEIKRHPSSKMMMLGEEGSKLDSISIWSLLFCRSLAREMTLRLAVREFSELRIFSRPVGVKIFGRFLRGSAVVVVGKRCTRFGAIISRTLLPFAKLS